MPRGLEDVFLSIEIAIRECGTPADDGTFASGYQSGLKEGLRKAREIVILAGGGHNKFSPLKALSRRDVKANPELSREDKILGLMKYYGISRRKAIEELEDSGDL